MCRLRRLRGKACFQVTLGLSPQLALHAQAAQRQQQSRFSRALSQPSFGPLEPLERVLVGAFSIKQGERAVPVPLKRFLDDPVGFTTIPELDEGARGRGRYRGTKALGARRIFPMPSEAFPIRVLARQYRDAGVDAHAIEGFRRHRIPFLQQARHSEDLVPICQALLRAQRQQQCRDMPGPTRVQFAQNGSRFEEAPFLQ